MHYIKQQTEIMAEEDGLLHTMSPLEIWNAEEDENREPEAKLASLGITPDDELRSPFAFLKESLESPFGEIAIGVDTPEGRLQLSPEHASNHACTDSRWYPFYDGSIEEIKENLRLYDLAPGTALTAPQYFTCRNQLEPQNEIRIEHEFDANKWASGIQHQTNGARNYFTAKLFDYQRIGSDWLSAMRRREVGAILGDGMGLGKTIQIIKVVCDLLSENPNARSLIICPSALVENWRREFERFSTGIIPTTHIGPNRTGDYRRIKGQVVLTTYDVARIDSTVLNQISWDLLALDEAQAIKNPDSKRTKAVKSIGKRFGVAVTGTPFENHTTDIWSLVDFCLPGLLGTKDAFLNQYPDEEGAAGQLGKLIAPIMLRRTLDDIPNDLPDLITIPIPMSLPREAAIEYERRKAAYAEKGALGAFGSLRNDLSIPPDDQNSICDLKYQYLANVLEEVVGRGEKIIVFVDRNAAIDGIESRMGEACPIFRLTGKTDVGDRQKVVDDFSAIEGSSMLLCNPTVGGAGLNITAANHIFHFTPSWNPALIDQANARAHRRGQQKRVIVHFPYYTGTVEEYMWNKVESKRDLSEAAVIGNKGAGGDDELSLALSYSPLPNI